MVINCRKLNPKEIQKKKKKKKKAIEGKFFDCLSDINYTVRPLFKTLHNTVKHMNLPTVGYKIYTTCVQFNTNCVKFYTSCVIFFTQQLVGSYVSQCCVNFLNSGLTVYVSRTCFL